MALAETDSRAEISRNLPALRGSGLHDHGPGGDPSATPKDSPERGRAGRAMLPPRHSTHEAVGRTGVREPVTARRVDSA